MKTAYEKTILISNLFDGNHNSFTWRNGTISTADTCSNLRNLQTFEKLTLNCKLISDWLIETWFDNSASRFFLENEE